MTVAEMYKRVGKDIAITDERTGASFKAQVTDIKDGGWGRILIQVNGGPKWFQPDYNEKKQLDLA